MQRNTVKEKKKSSQQKKILRWPCGFTTAVRDIIKEQMHMMSEQMGEILAEREKLWKKNQMGILELKSIIDKILKFTRGA